MLHWQERSCFCESKKRQGMKINIGVQRPGISVEGYHEKTIS